MPKPTYTLPFLSLLLVHSFFNLEENLKMANGQKIWCVVNPSTPHDELLANLDYACTQVGCSQIQLGGSCFYPNTYLHHASFATNLYYQRMGRHEMDCNFANSGLISLSDPSSGSCTYESGGEGNGISEDKLSETWCVAKPATEDDKLQENINFSCNYVECSPMQDGRSSTSCEFQGTGLVVTKNPGYGNCSF
ncbi:hypothetical protein MANES_15G118802v8 [Manihot esculenta]|uniref:Uncharacterized protein n=1 Tax=Manihot esculenta TaxID=3983 RepID=A0ACB7GAV2_MANES|nr:hypothetical protein MANES_15G118802v8 [Manihot esculenta]